MTEFYFAFLLYLLPGDAIPSFEYMTFATHGDCSAAIQRVETAMRAELPEGTEIRLSCVSSESLGQNSV